MFDKIFIVIISVIILSSFSNAQNAANDTITTPSGLKYIILDRGNGAKADSGKEVEVHYNWYLTNGRLIGSSIKTGHPFDFVLGKGKVIKGWDEGISYMHAGDHFKFIILPKLGYGEKGAGDVIPPNAELIYDTYLINVGKSKEQFIDTLYTLILKNETDTAVAFYHKLYETKRDQYNFNEDQLNILGFKLLVKERKDEAIRMLNLNIEMHPKSPNAYDSLGEAYLRLGNNDLALKNFQKALALDPHNSIAKYEVKKITETK